MSDAPWQEWVGRTETLDDRVTASSARALAATLDHPDPETITDGQAVPGLWTWLAFTPKAPMRQIGPDGHPKRGGFLPPIDLPRRMWAGSRCTFSGDVRIGAPLRRVSTIEKVTEKSGRSGAMAFVTVRHVVEAEDAAVYEEEQDIVYLPMPERFSPPPPMAAPECPHATGVAIDPVMLFRFSALTFNGHRIHYDRDYAVNVEKYPGLVVHGPLQAILLLDYALRLFPTRAPQRFAFRGVRPIFDFDAVTLKASPRDDGQLDLLTANGERAIGMQATLAWRD